MGKGDDQLRLPIQQHQERDSNCFWSDGIRKALSFKCVLFSILSLGVFLSAVFWLLPRHSADYGFDAKADIKKSAGIQGGFMLDMPPSLLISHIQRLEYDIIGEIGVPNSKVAILSMHEHGASNNTDVTFGVLPDPSNLQIDPVSLSLLKSSLIELFLQQSNLTFSTASVGQPSHFEILKFPGKLTVIPSQSATTWQIQQTLFNFTLNNSISEVEENFVEFRDQLKNGLRLASYENVYVQITNEQGSTVDKPVTVQVAIMSDLGSILPKRLRQLAQTIRYSAPSKNLGLNNTVFGKVKGVSLSSHMMGDLQPNPPTAAPAPAPGKDDFAAPSPSPKPAPPSYSPSPSPVIHAVPPCVNCDASSPKPDGGHPDYLPPANSPTPSLGSPPHPCPIFGPKIQPSPAPTPQPDTNIPLVSPPRIAPYPVRASPPPLLSTSSPLPSISLGSNPSQDDQSGNPSLHGPSLQVQGTTSSNGRFIHKELNLYIILILSILIWYC
ncbi:unnamed protein product [Rhodiola kirilowii]